MLKRLFALSLLASAGSIGPADAQDYVQGYTRSDGTYVAPYYRSAPDDSVTNNYSFAGNVNPYTGEVGTDLDIHDETSPYYEGPDDNGDSGHSDDDDGDDDDGDDN